MFAYLCLSCGREAYSAVSPHKVGPCPSCGQTLVFEPEAGASLTARRGSKTAPGAKGARQATS
jgi:hypothetical protein